MRHWALQDAKARLSEVVRLASEEGPQEVTVRGVATAVLISTAEYQRLSQAKGSFVGLIRHSPWMDVELDICREQSPTREIEF
ncbi:Antitoxin [Gammaproteobacteria bacterium]